VDFDDVFSAVATLGLETKKQGEFSREDLAPLAEVNVNSLKQYGYFTYAKVNGTKSAALTVMTCSSTGSPCMWCRWPS
jgi:ABC-type uncharacterized transport system substrate-binding protein